MGGRIASYFMKTLLLCRHAKSSWADAALPDLDRPLNERGLKAAPFMGELMREKKLRPKVILSSPALRAKATAEILRRSGELKGEFLIDHRIYEASPHTLSQVVRELDDECNSAMLVGHNPGMEGFIRYLTGNIEPMPTAALAIFDLNIEKWKEITDGCGKLRHLYRPKEEMS